MPDLWRCWKINLQTIVSELLDALEKDYQLRGTASAQFKSHLKHVRNYFGLARALEITGEFVDKYIGEQLEAGYKPATVNRGTQLLRQAYALAVERKHLRSIPPIRHLDESGNVRQGFFEEPDLRRTVAYLPEHLRDFTLYAYRTGWRKGASRIYAGRMSPRRSLKTRKRRNARK
jgi:hypothetical protein